MVQISHCGRTIAGEFVAFDIRWEGAITGSTVLWSVLISTDDGRERLQLGHERAGDGSFRSQFAFSGNSAEKQELGEDADLRDGELTVRFPASVVGVAVEWPVWRAVITVDGEDLDSQVISG
jgi:hypothetical protein